MKVICIDDEFLGKDGNPPKEHPKVSDIDEVIGNVTSSDNIFCYVLRRFPRKGWDAIQFIPLSDINEEEILLKRIIKEQTN